MERLDECRRLYLKLTSMETKIFSCKAKSECHDWISLKQNLRDVLSTLQLGEKFRHSIFDNLLNEKHIEQQAQWDYKLVSRAFGHLETYCRLLRNYPWKTEYHTLKTYGGFFKTYIHSVLPSSMQILRIIGYSPIILGAQAKGSLDDNAILKLNDLPNVALLETIGFDCLAASVECELRFEPMDLMANKLNNVQLDEIVTRRHPGTDRDRTKKNHLSPLLLTERRKIASLPRELEGYPRFAAPPILRSIAKSRTYHFEKLNLHEKRRNMFSNFEDDSKRDGVSFSKKDPPVPYNPEKKLEKIKLRTDND